MNVLSTLRAGVAALGTAAAASLLVSCGGAAPGALTPGPSVPTPVPSSLVVSLDQVLVANASTTPVGVTVSAVTATGQAVAGVPVSFAADPSVSISPASATTDANGQAAAQVRLLGKANRAVAITASAGTLSTVANFVVQGAALSATVQTPQAPLGSTVQVRFALVDSANTPMPNQTIAITSSLGSFPAVTGTTDATGIYTLSYVATRTGTDTLTAQAAGASPLVAPTVQIGAVTLPSPSATPLVISLQAQPSAVDANVSGSANRAQLTATVFGANSVPVQNAQVVFRLISGAQFGTLATSAAVLTDASGVARTDFVPGAAGSAQDQVVACVTVQGYTVSPANARAGCASNESGVALTVRQTPVSVVLAQSGVVIVPDDLSYRYQFLVQVARVGGAPVQDAVITVDPIDHPNFRKGFWAIVGQGRAQSVAATCPNEDANRNDILDPGEDANGNGILDPRRPVNYRFVGTGKTDALGQAVLEVVYPKKFGSWVQTVLSVRVVVGGSESRASNDFWLPVSATEANNLQQAPAFLVSPFGTQAGCNNIN